jgi:predicted O-methyltransferase YrrM
MAEPIDILAPAVRGYMAALRRPRDPLLARLEAEAREEDWPIIDRDAADVLEVLVLAARPERVLEIGTAIGYSGTLIARNLPPWGHLDTIEVDPETAERARRNFAEAGLAKKVAVHTGPALSVLPRLENRYDLVFIDAAKQEYEAYLAAALPLLPKGGVVVADNCLWHGRVVSAPLPGEERAAETEAIRRFNERLAAHPGLKAALLPIGDGGDGLGLAVKL